MALKNCDKWKLDIKDRHTLNCTLHACLSCNVHDCIVSEIPYNDNWAWTKMEMWSLLFGFEYKCGKLCDKEQFWNLELESAEQEIDNLLLENYTFQKQLRSQKLIVNGLSTLSKALKSRKYWKIIDKKKEFTETVVDFAHFSNDATT